MTERPILFSAPMVRALLDGRKTQTRRIVKRQFPGDAEPEQMSRVSAEGFQIDGHSGQWWDAVTGSAEAAIRCPYGVPGDTLWVRESWALHERFADVGRVVYAATASRSWTEAHRDFPIDVVGDRKARPFQEGFKPSILMPRWASRLTLEITDVRVERLQDISDEDAIAEGITVSPDDPTLWLQYGGKSWDDQGVWLTDLRRSYCSLWSQINGADSWAANPWVWAVSFRVRA